MSARPSPVSLFLIVLAVTTCGCNAEREGKVAMRRNCLAKLAEGYRNYFAQEKHCPGGAEALATFMESQDAKDEVTEEAIKRMRELDIQMFWDESLTDESVFDDKYVLGFEPSCMGAGGYYVGGGGTVDHVTGKKFQTMNYLPTKDNAK